MPLNWHELPNSGENSVIYAKQCLKERPQNSSPIQSTIDSLKLIPHGEGGYFVETDRDPWQIPNPFLDTPRYPNASDQSDADKPTRNAMTTIHYFLSPHSPVGYFHRNKARTVHTLHRGRAMYIEIDPDQIDEETGHAQIKMYVVGRDIANGEKIQWIVDGGKFKATYLLPDSDESGVSKEGLLISETVVPGFTFSDHDFMTGAELEKCVGKGEKGNAALKWLLKESLTEGPLA